MSHRRNLLNRRAYASFSIEWKTTTERLRTSEWLPSATENHVLAVKKQV
jgi:hypothetical protein